MNIKSKKYIVTVVACLLFSSVAINTRCQYSETEQHALNHLCRLTRMTGWQKLSEVKNNVEFWKIQLKKKIATYYSNGLTPLADEYVNRIKGFAIELLFMGIVASEIAITDIFAADSSCENTGRINHIQQEVTAAGACFGSALLGWFVATVHIYESKKELKKYKSILRQLETIKV